MATTCLTGGLNDGIRTTVNIFKERSSIGCLHSIAKGNLDSYAVLACLDWLYSHKMYQMEQHTLKNVNNCLNTNNYTYLETSGGQSSNLHLNVVHFVNTSVN